MHIGSSSSIGKNVIDSHPKKHQTRLDHTQEITYEFVPLVRCISTSLDSNTIDESLGISELQGSVLNHVQLKGGS